MRLIFSGRRRWSPQTVRFVWLLCEGDWGFQSFCVFFGGDAVLTTTKGDALVFFCQVAQSPTLAMQSWIPWAAGFCHMDLNGEPPK